MISKKKPRCQKTKFKRKIFLHSKCVKLSGTSATGILKTGPKQGLLNFSVLCSIFYFFRPTPTSPPKGRFLLNQSAMLHKSAFQSSPSYRSAVNQTINPLSPNSSSAFSYSHKLIQSLMFLRHACQSFQHLPLF